MKCIKCKTPIVRHLWLVGSDIYCSPKCERGEWRRVGEVKDVKFKYESRHRFNDKMVEKVGVAGLKKKQ